MKNAGPMQAPVTRALKIREQLGADGWGPEGTRPYYGRVFERVHLETAPPANACACTFVEAAQQAGFPLVAFMVCFSSKLPLSPFLSAV